MKGAPELVPGSTMDFRASLQMWTFNCCAAFFSDDSEALCECDGMS